jgi:hypothetical protein
VVVDAQLLSECGALGLDPRLLVPQEQRADTDPDVYEVWPENWDAVLLFMRLRNQWNWIAGMRPMRCGLNSQAALIEMQMHGTQPAQQKAVWLQLKSLEDEALDVWSTRAAE